MSRTLILSLLALLPAVTFGEGSLILVFEGRDFDSWRTAAPILQQHWADASFRVEGESDGQVKSALEKYGDYFAVASDFVRLDDARGEAYYPTESAWTRRKFMGADMGVMDAAVTGKMARVIARLAKNDEVTCCRFRGPIDPVAVAFVAQEAERAHICVRGIHDCPQDKDFAFVRQRLFSGFDGKFCKMQPCVATDWKGTALLTYQRLLLTGSDVFYGQYICRSTDGGRTWSEPKEIGLFKDRFVDGYRITHYANPRYLRRHDRWFALGNWDTFADDSRPVRDPLPNGKPTTGPLFVDVDAEKGEYVSVKELPFPFPYSLAMPFGHPVETEDGELIVPFYYSDPVPEVKEGQWSAVTKVLCVRYRFACDNLEVVRAGRPLACPELERGIGEPSLVRFGGCYYLTLRSNEYGAYAESADGLNFGEIRKWCWEDGTLIGNRNTQQHWIAGPDALYLAYTRENGANDHVFRNRAPLYLAKFDPARGCLLRSTEFPLVPELGARLGNFQTTFDGEREGWLITAEWMQPIGCERYGSDNSLWFVKLFFPH